MGLANLKKQMELEAITQHHLLACFANLTNLMELDVIILRDVDHRLLEQFDESIGRRRLLVTPSIGWFHKLKESNRIGRRYVTPSTGWFRKLNQSKGRPPFQQRERVASRRASRKRS